MTFRLAEALLVEVGARRKMLGSERVFFLERNSLQLHFNPVFKELDRGEARAAIGLVADLPRLSIFANRICASAQEDWNTIYRDRWTEILPENAITSDRVRREVHTLLDRVDSLDPDELIETARTNRPNYESMLQACHLGALAMAGDVAILQRYLDSFVAGDRLNFVPMFTIEMIERALEIAKTK